MSLNSLIIGTVILILFLIIYYPFFKSSLIKWKLNLNKQRELEIEIQKKIAKEKRDLEAARIIKMQNIARKEKEERLKIAKDKEVSENNKKYKTNFLDKNNDARISHEVQYTGAYRIPISDYDNYNLNIHGIIFFIDNLKCAKGKGEIEVRHNSFEDTQFDIYNLEIIDGFAILNQRLKNKNITPRKDHSTTFRQVFLTIRENTFDGIKTNVVHNIYFTPYSVLDWK